MLGREAHEQEVLLDAQGDAGGLGGDDLLLYDDVVGQPQLAAARRGRGDAPLAPQHDLAGGVELHAPQLARPEVVAVAHRLREGREGAPGRREREGDAGYLR
jgi:hypothetical protein